jgi:hypothetical protein
MIRLVLKAQHFSDLASTQGRGQPIGIRILFLYLFPPFENREAPLDAIPAAKLALREAAPMARPAFFQMGVTRTTRIVLAAMKFSKREAAAAMWRFI